MKLGVYGSLLALFVVRLVLLHLELVSLFLLLFSKVHSNPHFLVNAFLCIAGNQGQARVITSFTDPHSYRRHRGQPSSL